MEVKVKPLVWDSVDVPKKSTQGVWMVARTPIGNYEIHSFIDRDDILALGIGVESGGHPSIASAQAAVQAVYDDAIRSAIIPPTLSDALELPEIKAMRDALQTALYDAEEWLTCDLALTDAGFETEPTKNVRDVLRAALAALTEKE